MDGWGGIGTGWAVTSTLIGGMLAWGAIGFLVDLLVGTHRVFVAIGIVVGAGLATYIVYLRYGRDHRGEG